MKKFGNPTIVKVDKNGSEHWVDHNCDKCGGTGYIQYYGHIQGGVCFKCGGTGQHTRTWVVRTPEYQAILNERRDRKRREKNLANRQNDLKHNGFNQDGFSYIVVGNTFEIKEELKAAGAKFDYIKGWYFVEKNNNYECIEIHYTELYDINCVEELWLKENAREIVEAKMPSEESTSNFVGTIGEKVEVILKLIGCPSYDTQFGYTYINLMVDEQGNDFVWKTGKQVTEIGQSIVLRGTIKEHNEYKGKKQTILTRCKVA